MEELYEQNGYHGSTEKFFSLVEKCADKRPVSAACSLTHPLPPPPSNTTAAFLLTLISCVYVCL